MQTINQHSDKKAFDLIRALGNAYLENGENSKAIDKYQTVYSQGVYDKGLIRNYALALAGIEQTDEKAKTVYRKAVESDEEDETLYLTLSSLFIKHDITSTPALRIFRRALKYTPPFESRLKNAIEHIFLQTAENLNMSEVQQTLLECSDQPELLTIFLSAAWRGGKFDETVHILKNLFLKSDGQPLYLNALCKTFLEKKSRADEVELKCTFSTLDIQYCLKYRNPNQHAIHRIKDIDFNLDLKNLFFNFRKGNAEAGDGETFQENQSIASLKILDELKNIPIDFETSFNLSNDFIAKLNDYQKKHFPQFQTTTTSLQNLPNFNTLAIYDVNDFSNRSEISKLPFITFLNLLQDECSKTKENLVLRLENGLVILSTALEKNLFHAVETRAKLQHYNQLVDSTETIQLKTTLHHSPTAFIELENQGLKELRKGFKIHQLSCNNDRLNRKEERRTETIQNDIIVSEAIVHKLNSPNFIKTGDYRLPYFPHSHTIYKVEKTDAGNSNVNLLPVNSKNETPIQPVETPTSEIQTNNQNAVRLHPVNSKNSVPETKLNNNGVRPKLGKYEIIETLKETALTSTFKGYDSQLERAVILKAYKLNAFAECKDFLSLRQQFYEEVRKLNRIHHPNISVMYEAGEENELLYLAREYVEGLSVNKFLFRHGMPKLNIVLELYSKICKVILFFHYQKIWHKNLKPNNIFITPQNEIKLLDGGMMRVNCNNKIAIQNPDALLYTAPEQIQSQRITQTCDIFQLAVSLYKSLTGKHPFKARTIEDIKIKILTEEPAPPSAYREDIPDDLDDVILKALTKNPGRRFHSIQEFEAELLGIYNIYKAANRKNMFDIF